MRQDQVQFERLHFHELIHVVQWLTLGPERFLMAYADGLERFGYSQKPFSGTMAVYSAKGCSVEGQGQSELGQSSDSRQTGEAGHAGLRFRYSQVAWLPVSR